MAAVIRSGSANQNAVVVFDTYSSIPDPFLNRMPPEAALNTPEAWCSLKFFLI